MRSRPDTQGFNPEELDLLQECFDTLQRSMKFKRPSEEADAVATALILAYQRGVREKKELMRLAGT